MAESRLQRWSRKKTETGKKTELAPHPSVESEPSHEEQELSINETLSEHDVLEKYGLPDPDAIELGTDITGFMRKEIPELLRRRALRSLWKSNPVLAVLDGLNDYDEDFTSAASATGEQAETAVTMAPPEPAEAIEESESDFEEVPSDTAGHTLPVVTKTGEESTPRYRPRMRFGDS